MNLQSVDDGRTAREFLEVPVGIYRDDPNFIRPLDRDVNDVFDPRKNKAFRFGTCRRWILKDGEGRLAGRIAAFVHKKYRNKGDGQRTGGIGFFECINDQQAADMLFDVAKHWLMEKGMEAMDGPINFGERDRWWGLVIEGFKPPIYLMNYNLPYYVTLFENYGFRLFYRQICFHMFVHTKLSERFYVQDEKYRQLPEYRAVHFRKNRLEQFAADFTTVYNKAWAKHEGNKELTPQVATAMFRSMKPVIEEDLIWFVYHKDVPVACWVNLPELNQLFRHLNGRFDLLAKLKFYWLRRRRVCNKFTGIVFGVIPEYQGKGIDYYMIMEGARLIQKKSQYNEYEMQWMGDFNPKMINIAKNLGAEKSRTLGTYRYLFDRTLEFKRHPIFH